jgi:hypothetical protein
VSAYDKAPPAIAAILAGIDIDAADVIASCAKVYSDEIAMAGGVCEPYHIDDCDDRQLAGERLGRDLRDAEATALEACIRYHLRTAEEGTTS